MSNKLIRVAICEGSLKKKRRSTLLVSLMQPNTWFIHYISNALQLRKRSALADVYVVILHR